MPKNEQHPHFLTQASRPAVHLPFHTKRLEKALLLTLEHKKKRWGGVQYFLNFFSYMFRIKKFMVAGLAIFMLVGIIISFNFHQNISTVNAQTILAGVSDEVKGLPPEKVVELNQELQTNVNDVLLQAKAAKDLKYCNKEDCKIFKNNTISFDGSFLKDVKDLNSLEFTDPQGNTIFMAVDKNNIPAFVINFSNVSPADNVMVQFTPGESFPDGSTVQVETNMNK